VKEWLSVRERGKRERSEEERKDMQFKKLGNLHLHRGVEAALICRILDTDIVLKFIKTALSQYQR